MKIIYYVCRQSTASNVIGTRIENELKNFLRENDLKDYRIQGWIVPFFNESKLDEGDFVVIDKQLLAVEKYKKELLDSLRVMKENNIQYILFDWSKETPSGWEQKILSWIGENRKHEEEREKNNFINNEIKFDRW